MKLSASEYQRGILSWRFDSPATIRTASVERPDEAPAWSAPLTDSTGSVIQSPPNGFLMLDPRLDDPSAIDRPFTVCWERQVGTRIVTSIWENSLTQPPITLKRIPDYGIYHRLVIVTPFLQWPEDIVIRHGDIVIRFITGKLEGEYVGPFDRVSTDASGSAFMLSDWSQRVEHNGSFIEVVAPGQSPEQAHAFARALLGYIALCLGDQATGDVIFDEPYRTESGLQIGTSHVPIRVQAPRASETTEFDSLDTMLPTVIADNRAKRSLRIALAWYEKGLREKDLLDKLLAYFIAAETIIASAAKAFGPLPQVAAREEQFSALLAHIEEAIPDKIDRSRIRQKLLSATLTEQFAFYVNRHGWDTLVVKEFRALKDLRDAAVHGDDVGLTALKVSEAKQLLVRLLKSQVGFVGKMEWEGKPQMLSLVHEWTFSGGDGAPPD